MVVIQRMFSGTDSFRLMTVRLFMYAGLIIEKGGISKRLIDFANALVGWLPGGLAAVTIVSVMFFAGISGSAAADTAAVGALLIPAQLAGSLLMISDNPTVLLLLINLILLVAGTFVETTAALILLVPMIISILLALDIDLLIITFYPPLTMWLAGFVGR